MGLICCVAAVMCICSMFRSGCSDVFLPLLSVQVWDCCDVLLLLGDELLPGDVEVHHIAIMGRRGHQGSEVLLGEETLLGRRGAWRGARGRRGAG